MSTRSFGKFGAETSEKGHGRSGHQWKFRFANGFGASVIDDGYGGDHGLYELAVLTASGELTYDTPITNDVIGWLTEDEVGETLAKIEALSADDVEAEIIRRANAERDETIARLRKELAALEDDQAAQR